MNQLNKIIQAFGNNDLNELMRLRIMYFNLWLKTDLNNISYTYYRLLYRTAANYCSMYHMNRFYKI